MSGEILIELEAVDDRSLLYLGTANDATLKLTNLSGAPIAVSTATFRIVLSLSTLYVNPADQGAVSIDAAGWNALFVSGQFPAWELRPEDDMEWVEGTTLSFALSDLTPTVNAGEYNISVTIYGYIPMPYYASLPVDVAVANSGPADLTGTFAVDVAPTIVYGTKSQQQIIENTLEVTFMNTDPNVALVSEEWTNPPQFTISFVYSDTPRSFALTTPSNASAFEVGIAKGSGWQDPSKVDGPNGPKWLFQPEIQNQAVLGTGENAFITFSVGNVITEAAPGPTQMYVEWNGVPGYQDDNLSVVLYKQYRPIVIDYFDINQQTFRPGEQAYLSWSVDNAMLVELSGVGEVPREASGYAVTLWDSTTFVLTAIDPLTGSIETRNVSATVEPPIMREAIIPGTILMWYGDPAEKPAGFDICNGDSDTPDLRDYFILAAGVAAPQDFDDDPRHIHNMPSYTATQTTDKDGIHRHAIPDDWHAVGLDGPEGIEIHRTAIDAGGSQYAESPTQEGGDHDHSFALSRSGAMGENTALRPRWCALLYVRQK
jgi:hypothetical protein